MWVKERWGRAGHRIRRQGSSGLKNTPISGVICASIFGRVARTRVFALRLCKHRADFARQLPWTNSRVEKHSYKHTRGGGEGQRKRIWKRRGGESFRRFEPLTDLFGRERERGGGERQRKKRRKEGGEGRGRVFWRKTGRVASRFKSTHVCLSSRNSSFLRSCKREKGRCGQVNDPLSRGWRGLATAETGWPSIAMQAGKKSKRRNPRGAANREHLPVFTSQRTCVPRPNTGTGT